MNPDPDTSQFKHLLKYPKGVNPFVFYLITSVGLTPKEIDEMDLEDLYLLGECYVCDSANKINVNRYYSKMKKPK